MSFLTPLYIAGLAAVSLPILFHMLRRTPRGRQVFSTLMFLDPSHPRITRRNRLENWPLLLLRALALCLIAAAFARPFLRHAAGTDVRTGDGRQIALLLDTSASMRRDDLFRQAVDRLTTIVADTKPADQISVWTFDRRTEPILSFDEWSTLKPATRQNLLTQRLGEIAPGWGRTDLGRALITTAEALEVHSTREGAVHDALSKQIILITDLQFGSRLQALQTYQWPRDVTLSIERIQSTNRTNAGLQIVGGNDSGTAADDGWLRVRVINAIGSTRRSFQIHRFSDPSSPPVQVDVAAGKSRIVRLPISLYSSSQTGDAGGHVPPAAGASPIRLTLVGDDHYFDNTVYYQRPRPETAIVLYHGTESSDDPERLRYYVERAFTTDTRRRIQLVEFDEQSPGILPSSPHLRLVIVVRSLPEDQIKPLRDYVLRGGTLLCVASTELDCEPFARMFQFHELEANEADDDDYVMLTDVDYSHPMFAPFADSRFSDFTKIHIWKHRTVALDSFSPVRVLARFDDGDPAIVEKNLGAGRVLLFAFGWHPVDSQLALSSKFAPILNSLLDLSNEPAADSQRYTVGDAVRIAEPDSQPAPESFVRTPENREIQLVSGQQTFAETVVPGVYTVTTNPRQPNHRQPRFTVNLDADESKTSALPVESLEALGVIVSENNARRESDEPTAHQRQLRALELENRQKLWRWLILAAIGVLVMETWLGGWMANRTPVRPVEVGKGETAR